MTDGVYRERSWMCTHCGHVLDACGTDSVGKPRPPRDGDMSLCVNCASPYTRHGDHWEATTAEEWAKLSKRQQRAVAETAVACLIARQVFPSKPQTSGRA
ncbi:MAG TPA: hypothetical protein VGF65_11090 [Mycobacterium sp.]|jgi:hypothetical protein